MLVSGLMVSSNPNRPTKLHFHITSRCPYRCKHCCSDAGPNRESTELRLEDMERMVDQATGFGMEIFEISGGEPLILERRLLLETLRHASRRGLLTALNTNAYGLDREYASELVEAGLDKIKFSLYGANPQTHDEFTGAMGSFDRVLRGIEASKEEGMEVTVHFLITPKNLKELPALPSLLGPRGVDAVQLGSIVLEVPYRPPSESFVRPPSKETLRLVFDQLSEFFGRDRLWVYGYHDRRARGVSWRSHKSVEGEAIELMERRPCRDVDVSASLGISLREAQELLRRLEVRGLIIAKTSQGEVYHSHREIEED